MLFGKQKSLLTLKRATFLKDKIPNKLKGAFLSIVSYIKPINLYRALANKRRATIFFIFLFFFAKTTIVLFLAFVTFYTMFSEILNRF